MTISGSRAKWLVGIGVVSLCLNLFLAGLFGGHWLYSPRFGGPGGPRGPEAMLMGVPEDLRPLIKQKFDEAKPQFEAARQQMRDARKKVVAAAGADPFDPAAFDQAFDQLQKATDGIQTIAHHTILEILPQIPAKQRHDLVQKWSKRWGGKHDGPDDAPPPPQ